MVRTNVGEIGTVECVVVYFRSSNFNGEMALAFEDLVDQG